MAFTAEDFDRARKTWSECYLCNIDRHQCPGCGEPIPHGYVSCEGCARIF